MLKSLPAQQPQQNDSTSLAVHAQRHESDVGMARCDDLKDSQAHVILLCSVMCLQ